MNEKVTIFLKQWSLVQAVTGGSDVNELIKQIKIKIKLY